MNCDLIIRRAGQLLTCASGGKPKKGAEMLDLGIVDLGAVAVARGRIVAAGSEERVLAGYSSDNVVDAGGRVVMPGFVECHTHIVFAGDRLGEFELKIKGAEYLEILEAGGGILSTVRSTREADLAALVSSARARLDRLASFGVTACEIKTGYGLDTETELRMLEAIMSLSTSHPLDVVPTFLPAHAVPPEFLDRPDDYVTLVCDVMLPLAAERFGTDAPPAGLFVDVFCERGAFDLEQSRRILERARDLGFGIKAHVDEFTNLGGARMAIGLGAVSVDHLDAISDTEIQLLAASGTVGVVTPTVNFNLGSARFADARRLIDSGCAVALSTDYNPGSSPCPSPQLAMAVAARYQKMLPAEAINAFTANGASAAGLGATHGSLEAGKVADILVCDTADHREIVYEFGGNFVSKVFKAGVEIS